MPHSDRLAPPGICDTNPAGWVARCLDQLAVTVADADADADAEAETGAVPWFSRPSTGQAYAGPDRPISRPGLPGTARHITIWNPSDVAPMLAVDRLILLQHLAGPDGACVTCGPGAGAGPCQPLLLARRPLRPPDARLPNRLGARPTHQHGPRDRRNTA